MSDFDDLDGVASPHIPDDVAEQLLDGTFTGDGTNPHLADVAALLNAARTPADASELASMDATLAVFRGAVGASVAAQAPIARTLLMRKKLLTAKTAAVIGVISLATAGAAAAAGTLPNPFSKSAPTVATTADSTHSTDEDSDDTLVEDTMVDDTTDATTDDTEATTPSSDGTSSTADDGTEGDAAAQGPDATGPAKFGLCTAYDARTKHDEPDATTPPASSVAEALPIPFANLEAAAAAAGQTVEEFCADATPGGSATAPGQQDANPSATAPGQVDDENGNGNDADNPSATAPGHADDDAESSGSNPADEGSNPSQTAPGRSGDHGSGSGAGQGNGKG